MLREKQRTQTLESSISEGETGGLSVREPPFNGPLLWESRPDVRGETSCCTPHKYKSINKIIGVLVLKIKNYRIPETKRQRINFFLFNRGKWREWLLVDFKLLN